MEDLKVSKVFKYALAAGAGWVLGKNVCTGIVNSVFKKTFPEVYEKALDISVEKVKNDHKTES